MATYCRSYHWLQGGLLGPYYAQLYSWCTVRPYNKMVIFKLCNILLWIGNNYHKRAAELHYITFGGIILQYLAPVPLLLDGLGFSPRQNADLRKIYFPLHEIVICEKSKWSSPTSTRIFRIYTEFHSIW